MCAMGVIAGVGCCAQNPRIYFDLNIWLCLPIQPTLPRKFGSSSRCLSPSKTMKMLIVPVCPPSSPPRVEPRLADLDVIYAVRICLPVVSSGNTCRYVERMNANRCVTWCPVPFAAPVPLLVLHTFGRRDLDRCDRYVAFPSHTHERRGGHLFLGNWYCRGLTKRCPFVQAPRPWVASPSLTRSTPRLSTAPMSTPSRSTLATVAGAYPLLHPPRQS